MSKGSSQAVTRREHDLSMEAKRVELVDAFGGVITSGGNYAQHTEVYVDGTTTTVYKGLAQIGSDDGESVWQIYKLVIDESDHTSITKTWGNGTDAFTNKWSDYLTTISYS